MNNFMNIWMFYKIQISFCKAVFALENDYGKKLFFYTEKNGYSTMWQPSHIFNWNI